MFALLGLISAGAALLLTSKRVWPMEVSSPWVRAVPGRCPPPSGAAPGESDERGGPVAGEDASRTTSGPVRPDPPGLRPRGAG